MFFVVSFRHLNSVERNPQRINKDDKEIVNKLSYEGIKKKIIVKLKSKILSALMCLVMIIN